MQISLSWMLCKNPYIIPSPGSRKPTSLRENLGSVEIALSSSEIASIDTKLETMDLPAFGGHYERSKYGKNLYFLLPDGFSGWKIIGYYYMETLEGEQVGSVFYDIAFGKNAYYKHQGWLSGRVTTDDNLNFFEKLELDKVANVAELVMSHRGAFITGADFLIDDGATAFYFYGFLRQN